MLMLGIPYEFSLLTDTTNIQDHVVTSIAEKGHLGQGCTATLICDRGQLRYNRLGKPAVGAQKETSQKTRSVLFYLSQDLTM